jgi:calcium-translocating P-type ATPase
METGLTAAEAKRRFASEGPNELPRRKPRPLWRKLGAQVFHFFAVLLWGAAGLAVLAGMPQLGAAIVVVVLVNGLFAFAQEERAEHAAQQLDLMLPRRATVCRDGHPVDVDARDLVVGDRVLLGSGDRVCADLRLTEAFAVSIDASLLTGESVASTPEMGAQLYAGTFVVSGEGAGTVTATGARTRLARIAELTREKHRPLTPLARELNGLVRTIAAVSVAVGLVFFGVGVAAGLPAAAGFLFAIGVTVALVPEGLLPTVTLSLAVGARKMAGRNALVRRLDAVETLGSTTFICTDKTGTLTENRMSVVEAWTPAGAASVKGEGYAPIAEVTGIAAGHPALHRLGLAAARCSAARVTNQQGVWAPTGDPMEAALYVLAMRLGLDPDADSRKRPSRDRRPFDPRRRRMSLVVGDELVVKGALESILPRCSSATPDAGAVLAGWARRGLRVMAVARRSASAVPHDATPDEAERELELLGILGLEDPPRKSAPAAIAACRGAGLRVVMVTGDHPGTALAVAQEVGLVQVPKAGGSLEECMIEGKDLPADEAKLGALLDRDGLVVARVSPEDKHRIARALQRRAHVVAMTGDGVNDGPALQQADIGIAMGRSGTDIAREAADLVLLDDDFATIVAAIECGRATFANLRRFLTYHLTDNVAELAPFVVWALSGGKLPLALGVLQVLSLDLVTDQLPALALGAEPPGVGVLQKPPSKRHLVDSALLVRAFLVLGIVEAAMGLAAFATTLAASGWHPGSLVPAGPELRAASGAMFCAVVLGQAANAFCCRSETRFPWALKRPRNRALVVAVAIEFALLLATIVVAPLARLLDQAAPSKQGVLITLMAAPAVLAADALYKSIRSRKLRGSARSAR